MSLVVRRQGFRGRSFSALVAVLLIAVAALAGSAPGRTVGSASPAAGAWRMLPQAPFGQVGQGFTGVWAGSRMLVFGGVAGIDEGVRAYVGAAYDPATESWSPLPDLRTEDPYGYRTVWTGKEMIAFSALGSYAYDPQTGLWRRLPNGGGFGGVLAWTGRELIAWGGGCCGEDSSAGYAYNPTTNRWRKLARSPLAPSQAPVGAWTGRELVIVVSGLELDVSSKPYPPSYARAAAYNPRTNTWRRIAPTPELRFWSGASAIWDGREVLFVGGAQATSKGLPGRLARVPLAYNPKTNRWRRLAPMETGRVDFAAVWTGKQLLVWGGQAGTRQFRIQRPPRGFAYNPATDRWSRLPQAPLRGRVDPVAVWTGRAMIIWGGGGLPEYRSFTDGASFTPATP